MNKIYILILLSATSALASDPPLVWSADSKVAIKPSGMPVVDSEPVVAPTFDPAIGIALQKAISDERRLSKKRESNGARPETESTTVEPADQPAEPNLARPVTPESVAVAVNPLTVITDIGAAAESTASKQATKIEQAAVYAPSSNNPFTDSSSPVTKRLEPASDDTITGRAGRSMSAGGAISSKSNESEIEITDSHKPTRGVNVRHEMPSVRHITMSPGNKWFGGDDVEVAISPIFDVILQMPDSVEWFTASNEALTVEKVPKQPTMLKLKLKPINNPVPMSLQIVDVYQKIWTFTVIGVKADLATEYPKTLLVNKRVVRKTVIGSSNPNSILNALPLEYAIQAVVGDLPNTSEFKTELAGATYMHHEGYATYLFSVSKKDGSNFEKMAQSKTPNLRFTLWANGHRIDGGGVTTQGSKKPDPTADDSAPSVMTRDVEWTIETSTLSKSATRKSGKETYIVVCQIRTSLIDLEEWNDVFITISDAGSYSRFDFKPYRREFRAPSSSQDDSGE